MGRDDAHPKRFRTVDFYEGAREYERGAAFDYLLRWLRLVVSQQGAFLPSNYDQTCWALQSPFRQFAGDASSLVRKEQQAL
jgi:hypothetical protein